jgi:hypothetical protein
MSGAAPIRIDLTLPVTRVGFGIFSFDPLEQALGRPVMHFLEPLMVGKMTVRPSAGGRSVEGYPLGLPDGEGAVLPLGTWGEAGFRNERGLLVVTVPWAAASWLTGRLGEALVRGPEAGVSSDGTARVADMWLRLRPGMKAVLPLGALGEAGVEAA